MTYIEFIIFIVILNDPMQIATFTEEVEFIDDCNTYDDGAEEEEEEYVAIEKIFPNLETACKINARASDEDVQYVLDNIVPETRVQKCFVACWMERLQIVQSN